MTNQNDTQDEAGKLANDYANTDPVIDIELAFIKGYRAGVASLTCKHPGCACVCGHQGKCPEDGPIATGGTYE